MMLAALGFAASLAAVAAAQAPAVAAETVTVRNGSMHLKALLWRPAGDGPFPAVIFNHGSGPANDPANPPLLAAPFVRRGYLFLYLYRRGAGLSADQGTNSVALMGRAFERGGQAARNAVQLTLLENELTDVTAALAVLRQRPDVDPKRIAVAGHSFGGQLALLLTEREPDVRAGVLFAPAAGSWERSPLLQRRLRAAARATHAPLFLIYAENDFTTAPAHVLTADVAGAGKPIRMKIYPAVEDTPEAGHDFVHRRVAAWEPDVFAFLADALARPKEGHR